MKSFAEDVRPEEKHEYAVVINNRQIMCLVISAELLTEIKL